MVVMAIAAITFPVLTKAKAEAFATSDIGNLRQMGLARQMYLDLNDDRFDESIRPLVDARLVPAAIAVSSLDRTIDGWGNRFRARKFAQYGRSADPHEFKSSYPTINDNGLRQDDWMRMYPGNSAWMFSPGRATSISLGESQFCGQLSRLKLDGSVQQRYAGSRCGQDGQTIDFTDYWGE
ncbi:MAG: hypothetical protein LCH41_11905 [Armatimonadetes bacterium]|nr:hypothetical protein [Armatimonadota bacterium]